MRIDWVVKLQHLLQVMAFCLAIATIQYAFLPDRPYAPPVVYSVLIGFFTWAVIDLGRHLFPSSVETGWPRGFAGVAIVAAGIAIGYATGNAMGDRLCHTFGFYTPGQAPHDPLEVRYSMLVTVLAGVTASFYFYAQGRSSYLERQMGEAQRLADEARLKLLEAQLEPHMLFNTLANLRALIAADPPRAQGMLDHMIGYLRATLDASRSTLHPLHAEFDRLQDYLELMAIRMGDRLRYELVLPRELAPHRVPALLLQPVVENSIRHGLEPKLEGGHVLVSAHRDGGCLVLEVKDTGLGAAPSPAARDGFGLAQVRERLATVYGSAATLQFTAEPGAGATTVIRLPSAA